MSNIRVFNHGPQPIEIIDGSGQRTSMGEGAGNEFTTPVQVYALDGSVTAEQPAGGGPLDESPTLVPGGAAAVPDTEFEFVSSRGPQPVALTLADSQADLAGTPRPDNPSAEATAQQQADAAAAAAAVPETA